LALFNIYSLQLNSLYALYIATANTDEKLGIIIVQEERNRNVGIPKGK
jgi:hypothetical protein